MDWDQQTIEAGVPRGHDQNSLTEDPDAENMSGENLSLIHISEPTRRS